MKKIGTILKNYDPKIDKHVSREFQAYGIHLAEELDDYKHRGLYIKLAKTHDRNLLEKAFTFTVDSKAKNKGALFMWKLAQLKAGNTTNATNNTNKQIKNK
jgi:hypothetical protein